MDATTARKTLFAVNLVLGALFLLAPRLTLRLYGLDPDKDAAACYPLRYFGGRLLLFALLLSDEGAGRRALLDAIPAIAATDAGLNLLAAVSGEVPKRTVMLGAATSAAAYAIAAIARSE